MPVTLISIYCIYASIVIKLSFYRNQSTESEIISFVSSSERFTVRPGEPVPNTEDYG
jgi:hypothetical protein